MTGKITIEATEHGYGFDCALDDMSVLDKLELMHALSVVLNCTKEDMHLFFMAEQLGIMREVETTMRCMTNDQLQSMLRGEQPEGVTINMTELRRQLNES